MKVSVLSLVLAVVLSATTLCHAYPEPAILAGLSDWTLDVAFDQPQQITVKLPTDPANAPAKRFWYTIISLTNNSRQLDVPFYPACELMTDTFQIVQTSKDSTRPVFEKIKLRHQGQYPFLEPIEFVDNKVLQGFDNTVDLAIIWPDFDEKAKNVSLFIAGLSNETTVFGHPIDRDISGKPIKVFLRKTLKLDYAIGGDKTLRANAAMTFKKKQWIMR